MMDHGEPLLSMREVCRFFGGKDKPIDQATIYRWVVQGKLAKSIKLGHRTFRWRLSDCQAALERMARKDAA